MRASVTQARILLALRSGPGTAEELGERAHDGAHAAALRKRLRGMEEKGWVRRSDERADGSHVWQITKAGREEAALAKREMPREDVPSVAQPGEVDGEE
jgi:DNA-binding MarR family transcriptional regulator